VITAEQRSDLAVLLANAVALALKDALVFRDRAFLVVSGGKSPVPFFEALGDQDLDWSRVDITLADERWVDESHADSNAALVRQHLLGGKAGAANWLPYVDASLNPERGLPAATRVLGRAAWPIDVLVLGMGTDGHTASLFPASTGLADACRLPMASYVYWWTR
jgi:6-phosphogluconolactonase